MLDLLGPVAIPTIVCLVVGVVMLIIEMLTPGLGIAGGVGLLSLIAVVVMQFSHGSKTVALVLVAVVLVLIIAALLWFIRSFSKGRLSKSFLVQRESINASSSNAASQEAGALNGKTGVAITTLRPSGIAEFDGQRVNVVTAGEFIEAGKPVKIAAVSASGLDVRVEEATQP